MTRFPTYLLLVTCTCAACVTTAPTSTGPGPGVTDLRAALTTIRIDGEGGDVEGEMSEAAYASESGACVRSRLLTFGADGFQVAGFFDATTLTAPLPSPSESDAHLRSQIWRSDGSSGVVVDGSIALEERPNGYLMSIDGDSWCDVSASGELVDCVEESTEATFSIEFLSDRLAPDCALEADPGVTRDGACAAALQPVRCVGDPAPPQQDGCLKR